MSRVSNAIFTSNKVLVAIPQAEEAILRPFLSKVRLVGGQILVEQGQAAEHVYFIESGVATLVAQTAPGQPAVQIAMIGREGLVGALALLDTHAPAFAKVVMLLPGTALRIPVQSLHRVLESTPVLRSLSLNSVLLLTRQLMHAAASSITDTLMVRCARWLLMAHDRIDGDDLPVTHEAVAVALGVRRAGVTLAVMTLQQAGFIRTARGRIRVADRPGLERFAEGGGSGKVIPVASMVTPQDPQPIHLDPRARLSPDPQRVVV